MTSLFLELLATYMAFETKGKNFFFIINYNNNSVTITLHVLRIDFGKYAREKAKNAPNRSFCPMIECRHMPMTQPYQCGHAAPLPFYLTTCAHFDLDHGDGCKARCRGVCFAPTFCFAPKFECFAPNTKTGPHSAKVPDGSSAAS